MGVQSSKMQRPEDNLSAIRLMAAIVVIYGHSFPLTGLGSPGYLSNGIQTIAVKIFFIISGMLITESWVRDPNILRYAQRRLLRIIPGLLIICVLTAFVVGPLLSDLSFKEYYGRSETYQYLWNIVFYPVYELPGVFLSNIYPVAVNGSLWTLPVEMAMYMVVPLVMLFGKFTKAAIFVFAVGSLAISIIVLRCPEPLAAYVVYGTNLWSAADIVPYFFAGMAITVFDLKKHANLQISFIIFIIAPFFAFNSAVAEVALLIVLPFVVMSFAYAVKPRFSFVDRLGDISYGVYLYGFLVQQIVVEYLELGRTPAVNTLLTLVPVIVLGYLSWNFVEKPALKLKPRNKI